MNLTVLFRLMLLILLVVCALAVNLTKNLLQTVIIFMSYSSIMCILWVLMESPDLAITEAAVGTGISGTLFLMTLKKISAEDAGEVPDEETGMIFDNEAAAELEEINWEEELHSLTADDSDPAAHGRGNDPEDGQDDPVDADDDAFDDNRGGSSGDHA